MHLGQFDLWQVNGCAPGVCRLATTTPRGPLACGVLETIAGVATRLAAASRPHLSRREAITNAATFRLSRSLSKSTIRFPICSITAPQSRFWVPQRDERLGPPAIGVNSTEYPLI